MVNFSNQESNIEEKKSDKENNNNFEKNSKKRKKIKYFFLISAIILTSAFFGAFFGYMAGGVDESFLPFNKNQKESTKEGSRIVIQEESSVINVVDKSKPAVVSIVVTKDVPKIRNFFESPNSFDDFFFNPFMQEDEETEKQKVGGGSGFIVNKEGYIVTNKHVVSDPNAEYTVITNDKKEHTAQILALHPSMDIAVMKISGNNFPFLEMGSSKNLKVGQSVITIGNSLGQFINSVSLGIVSGLQRNVVAGSGNGDYERLSNIIQTDAAINPGNSGGPLLDMSGKVIGVNVAVAQGAENIGFALPIDQVNKTINQVKEKGKISVPFLGVRYVILDEEIQKKNNLPFDYGALVLRGESRTDFAVIPGSPANKAGLKENDIILKINDKKITKENTLNEIISKYKIGDKITLEIWKDGKTENTEVTLGERN